MSKVDHLLTGQAQVFSDPVVIEWQIIPDPCKFDGRDLKHLGHLRQCRNASGGQQRGQALARARP